MTNRTDSARSNLITTIRARPFRPFAVTLENGDRVIVEHPENVAFDPTENGDRDVMILGLKMKVLTNLDAVTSIVLLDRGE